MAKFLDADHPFFRPAWRRAAVVGFCAAWSAVEWWNGEAFWGILTAALAGYCAYALFINFEPKAEAPPDEPQ